MTKAEYKAVEIGKDFWIADCRGKEGLFFTFNEARTPCMVWAFPHMKPDEIQYTMDSNGRIGLFMYMNAIFIAAKFGHIDGDCAYNVHIHNINEVYVNEPKEGEGLAMQIYAVESTTNIVKGIRVCGMGNRWTKEFRRLLEIQKTIPYDEQEFYALVQDCHRRWSVKDMLRMCTAVYKVGTHENETPINTLNLRP